jgi:hypothetical protein
MRWRKLGLVYVPDGHQAWARSHAMAPTPVVISDRVARLYVGHLDAQSVGRIGWLDVGLDDPTSPIAVAERPALDIGVAGAFDDNGVVPSCIVDAGGQLRLYYSGFQLQQKIPYTIFSSLATSNDGGRSFQRVSDVPLLDRIDGELFFRAAPFVLQDSDKWRMWFIGGGDWAEDESGKRLPRYSLRHTDSPDGVTWRNRSVECLVPRPPDEIGFGRPFIRRDAAGYRMWYSIRARSGYRLGYAESPDGLAWRRDDERAGIGCSTAGWDSEMICYAAIVPMPDRWLMFYNGNGYGRTGVGVAIADCR